MVIFRRNICEIYIVGETFVTFLFYRTIIVTFSFVGETFFVIYIVGEIFVTFSFVGETSVTCDIQDDRKRLVARVPEEIVIRDGVTKSEPVTDISMGSSSPPNPRKRRKRSHRY